MAFDTLGINVTASGIAGVARQIGHLSNSFLRYINTVQRVDNASMRAANAQSKLADTMLTKNVRALDALYSRQSKLTAQTSTLTTAVRALGLVMRDPVAAFNNYTVAANNAATAQRNLQTAQNLMSAHAPGTPMNAAFAGVVQTNQIALDKMNVALRKASKEYAASIREQAKYADLTARLTAANRELADILVKLPDANNDVAESAKKVADANANIVDAQSHTAESTGLLRRLLSDLTGGFGQSATGAGSLLGGITKLQPHLLAIGVAMDVLAVGAKFAQLAFNLFVNALKIAWNVIKKTVEIVWNLAKAIGTTLWNAFKKVVSLPFALINRLFGGMGGSMQRVLEMAIGMNLSRVWWQLGMKMRDMAKMAAQAATEYQVTFIRLRGLMLNETLNTLGINPGDQDYIAKYNLALKEATKMAEALVTWTSKLAVTTIFDAESILDVYTLAMSYGFASKNAKELTQAVLDFATGMGLGDTEMRRVIENFGQMRAQGKITGTELRDLARGSFVPVNDVLERLAKNAGLVGDYNIPNLQEISDVLANMKENGEITAAAFDVMSQRMAKLGADGKITRQEFESLAADFRNPATLTKFGLTAEQAGKALEGIKTGQLTKELNELIATGKLTIDEFFEAFIEMAEDRFPNAAQSMGVSMKAVISNIGDYIKTMFGWRLLAPVFEIVAKHVQDFIQSSLMSPKQIAMFDRMGRGFKAVTELVMTYSDALFKAKRFADKFFGAGNIAQIWRFAGELTNILGSLGTEDFAKNFDIFGYAIKQIPLAGESRQLVLKGVQNLNKIMTDIMAGVDIDAEALGQSLDDVFGTLWREYFQPEMSKFWDEQAIPLIKEKIGKMWEGIKTAFNDWKTETLIPYLETFLTVTVPGWFETLKSWIETNGPTIISTVSGLALEILGALATSSSDALGEDNLLTQILRTLESIAGYATLKIEDPTSDLDQAKIADIKTSFSNIGSALGSIIGNVEPVKTALAYFNTDEFKNVATNLGSIALSLNDLANFKMQTGALADLESLNSFISTLTTSHIEDGTGGLSGLVKTVLDIKIISDTIIEISKMSGDLPTAWDTVQLGIDILKAILTNLDDTRLIGEAVVAAWENSNLAERIRAIFRNLTGITGNATESGEGVTGILATLNNWLNPPEGINPTIPPIEVPAPNITLPQLPPLEPIVVEQPYEIRPFYTFGINASPIGVHGSGYVPFAPDLSTLWNAGNLFPNGQSTQIILPAPDIKIEGDLNVRGGEQAELFVAGFTDSIITGMEDIEVPMPEINVTRRRPRETGDGEDPIAQFIADIAALFTADTSISSAATAMFGAVPDAASTEFGKVSIETFQLIHDITDILYNSSGTMYTTGANMMQFLVDAITEKSTDAADAVSILVTNLLTTVSGMESSFNTAGANAVLGLKMGMQSEMQSLIEWWIKEVTRLNNIVPTLNIQNSPSRLYRGYGEDMIKGMQLGIEHGSKGAESSMRKAATDIKQATSVIAGSQASSSYSNVSNINNWNVRMSAPIVASTPLQAYEVLRMRAR